MPASTPPTAAPSAAPARTSAPTAAPAPAPGTVLVLGATGKTGRRVADRLDAAGLPVRPAPRSGDVRFDSDHPATPGPAPAGPAALYPLYSPALPGPRPPQRRVGNGPTHPCSPGRSTN